MEKQKTIFVVDDDPFITNLVAKRLANEGYIVEAFDFGEDCLESLKKNPDIIILDYYFHKPEGGVMNGMEILNKIREVDPDMPVIILSGQDKGEIVLELARKGINDYIIKDNNIIDNLKVAIGEIFESTE